jgi:hypothetical protein
MSEVTPPLETTEQSGHNPSAPKVEKAHPDVHRVSGSVRSSIAKRAFLVAFLAGTGASATVGSSTGCLQDFEKFRPGAGTGAQGGSVSSTVGGSGGTIGTGANTSSSGSTGGMENVGGGGSTSISTGGTGGMENVGGGGSSSSSTGGAGGEGGSMNVGGSGGTGGAGCMDIPVTVGDASGADLEVKQYNAGCSPNGADTLGNAAFETSPQELCVKNNGSLIVQSHNAADMNSLVIDSPVTPSKIEFFQLGVATPISDAEADAYCTTNGTMLNPVTADQDPTATGFEYTPGNVGQSNLWKITF